MDDNPGYGEIAVAPDGRVYVADGSNNRVQVFAPDGEFLFQFGSFGTGEGQFGSIEEIADRSRRQRLRAATGTISKFTADGKFMWRTPENIDHFAVRTDAVIVEPCERRRVRLNSC